MAFIISLKTCEAGFSFSKGPKKPKLWQIQSSSSMGFPEKGGSTFLITILKLEEWKKCRTFRPEFWLAVDCNIVARFWPDCPVTAEVPFLGCREALPINGNFRRNLGCWMNSTGRWAAGFCFIERTLQKPFKNLLIKKHCKCLTKLDISGFFGGIFEG